MLGIRPCRDREGTEFLEALQILLNLAEIEDIRATLSSTLARKLQGYLLGGRGVEYSRATSGSLCHTAAKTTVHFFLLLYFLCQVKEKLASL